MDEKDAEGYNFNIKNQKSSSLIAITFLVDAHTFEPEEFERQKEMCEMQMKGYQLLT